MSLNILLYFALSFNKVTVEVCHPQCVCENWKGYIVKHNCVD